MAYHPTFGDGYLEGEYDDLGIGLADDLTYADEEQEIGALWRDDAALLEDDLEIDLEDDPIAILSAGDDADALAYVYEDALDAPQLEAWAGVEAGEYGRPWIRPGCGG